MRGRGNDRRRIVSKFSRPGWEMMRVDVLLTSREPSHGLMEAEIRHSALADRLCSIARLGPGTSHFCWEGVYGDLAPALSRETIVFCRHVAPLEGRAVTLDEAAALARRLLEGRKGRLGVQVWGGAERAAGEVRRALVEDLERDGWTFRPAEPDLVLSGYLAGGEILLGVSRPAENRSPFPGGAFRLEAREGPSRSRRKLEEAFRTFGLSVPGRRVLDIGAAPGGWTEELLQMGFNVTAVDRAAIDVRPRDGLTLVRGDFRRVRLDGPFDGVFSDANGPYREVGEGLARLRPSLRAGAVLLWTVKFGRTMPLRALEDARRILSKDFRITDGRQLFHNRQEATLVFRAAGEKEDDADGAGRGRGSPLRRDALQGNAKDPLLRRADRGHRGGRRSGR